MGHYCNDIITGESNKNLEECGTYCHSLGTSILYYNGACSWPPCSCSCCSHSTSFTASNDSDVGNVYVVSGTANIFRSFLDTHVKMIKSLFINILLIDIHLSGCFDHYIACESYLIPTYSCDDLVVKKGCKLSCNLCNGKY